MQRQDFTIINSQLETEMREAGEIWVNDWWLRSAQAQNALFMIGRKKNDDGTFSIVGDIVTNCDGYVKHSKHQSGCAVDKYFVKNGTIVFNWDKDDEIVAKYQRWHARATELGMKPIVTLSDGSQDMPHFEG